MKFLTQAFHLYDFERFAVIGEVYRALSCLYPHTLLP